jgi:hypothetical protein
MAGKVRTWVWVVVGILAFGFVCIIGVAGAGFYFFRQHIQTRTVSAVSAAHEFEQVRTRFKNQKPLIELDRRGHFVRSNPSRPSAELDKRPDVLNVLAFDPDDGQIVHVTIPFWLLRLKTGGARVDLNGNRMNLDDLRLSVEDLERYGPTLIVDHNTPDGERVLVWSQ